MPSVCRFASVLLFLCGTAIYAQTPPLTLESALVGRQVLLKIDMPGSQKGIDLRLNTDSPMNWKEYYGRIKSFGVALHKGETVRITAIVRKNELIEVQLEGGGFGTFGDDTITSVTAKKIEKSDSEKRLEEEIATTTDDDKRRDLQRDLDRERSRRERENSANERDAKYASVEKAAQVAEQRSRGGSRINLRWSGTIPEQIENPSGLLASMSDYMLPSGVVETASGTSASPPASTPPNLKQGMTLAQVSSQIGEGTLLSESVSDDGLTTRTMQYVHADHIATVTYVNGIVVKYTINSR